MGQRHQVFLIARVVPHGSTTGQAYYRCIAAHHHQWCYGSLPLRATRRFLTLIQNENNAQIIRDEIRRVQSVYGRKGQKPAMPLMPCPYTLLLLIQAWNMDLGDLEQPYTSGAGLDSGVLSPNMGSFDGDNNDGITVIDVTEPTNPAYCFVTSYRSGPVDMKGYISGYYDLSDIMKKAEGGDKGNEAKRTPLESAVVQVVSALEGVPVITSGMFAEAWPREYEADSRDGESENPEVRPGVNPIPSLVELSISPAVEQSLSADDTIQLEEMVWQPGKADLMKKALMAKNPFPDSGVALLTKIIEHEFESAAQPCFSLDLSTFSLSSEQIVRVINAMSGTVPKIKSLDISGNQNISASTIAEVLTAIPNLLRLVLLNTSIADDDLLDLMSTSPTLFFRLHDLVHPAFLRSTSLKVRKDQDRGSALLETLHPAYRYGLTVIFDAKTVSSIAFFNPEKIIRSLTRQLSVLTSPQNADPFFSSTYNQSGLGPAMALSAGITIIAPRKARESDQVTDLEPAVVVDGGDDWDSRTVASIPRRHSLDCFKGVGWTFVLDIPQFSLGGMHYAFVKADHASIQDNSKEKADSSETGNQSTVEYLPADAFRLYDVRGFAKEMEKEGRPIPSEESIAAFEKALGVIDETTVDLKVLESGDTEAALEMLKKLKVVMLMSQENFEKLKNTSERMFPAMLHMNMGWIAEYE